MKNQNPPFQYHPPEFTSAHYATDRKDLVVVINGDTTKYVPCDLKNVDYVNILNWVQMGGVIDDAPQPEQEEAE